MNAIDRTPVPFRLGELITINKKDHPGIGVSPHRIENHTHRHSKKTANHPAHSIRLGIVSSAHQAIKVGDIFLLIKPRCNL